MLASVDVHAPAKWRTNVIVTNFDEFHKEFDVKRETACGVPRRSCYYLVKSDEICPKWTDFFIFIHVRVYIICINTIIDLC